MGLYTARRPLSLSRAVFLPSLTSECHASEGISPSQGRHAASRAPRERRYRRGGVICSCRANGPWPGAGSGMCGGDPAPCQGRQVGLQWAVFSRASAGSVTRAGSGTRAVARTMTSCPGPTPGWTATSGPLSAPIPLASTASAATGKQERRGLWRFFHNQFAVLAAFQHRGLRSQRRSSNPKGNAQRSAKECLFHVVLHVQVEWFS